MLEFFSRSIYAKTKAPVLVQTKMSEKVVICLESGWKTISWYPWLRSSLAKTFCPNEVVFHFIKGRHEVSFSGYCFVRFPHVHAQPFSTRLFGLGHQNHNRYPGSGSISGLNDTLLQQEINTTLKNLSVIKWDASVQLLHRFHILINMQFHLNILYLSKGNWKDLGNSVTHSFPQTQHLQFAVFQAP